MSTPLEKSELKAQYKALKNIGNSGSSAQKRGYAFEHILYSILYHEGLEPISSFKVPGEQIDGSFFWMGQTFLFEAKWHNDVIPASHLYAFKGKVDGKFHTSSGLFISMSGYSEDAPDALRFGKAQNILLFDKSDLDYIFLKEVPFLEVLKFKIRHAGDTGNPYVAFKTRTEASASIKTTVYSRRKTNRYSKQKADLQKLAGVSTNAPLFLIVCEGTNDAKYVKNLVSKWRFDELVAFQIIVAGGTSEMSRFVSEMSDVVVKVNSEFEVKGVVVLYDGDAWSPLGQQLKYRLEDLLQKSSTSLPVLLVGTVPSPEYVAQFGTTNEVIMHNLIKSFIEFQLVGEIDLEQEAASDAIAAALDRAEWDYETGLVYIPGDDKHEPGVTCKSLHQLRLKLGDIGEGATTGYYSTDKEMLADRETPDFSGIVEDRLIKYKSKIKRIGWWDEY